MVSIPSQPSWAGGRSGHLDPSFGHRGTVLTDFGEGNPEVAYGLAIQSDGKIVAAGSSDEASFDNDFALARYAPNGHLDRSFGTDGKVLTDFSGSMDEATAVAIQPDGKIVAAGFSLTSGNDDFALARYLPDGTLDSSFNGTGKVLTDFSGSGSVDVALGVAIQPDGKIVAAGYSFANGNDDFALARYLPDGTLDGSFNVTGTVVTDFSGSGSIDIARAVAIQPDGKIVAAGNSGFPYDFGLARYMPDGSLDTTFNSTGKVVTDFGGSASAANGVAIQPDGKIVAAGYSSYCCGGNLDFALARYLPDGTLDSSFNATGKVLTDFSGSGSDDRAQAVAIQSDGKIMAAGASSEALNPPDYNFALARYMPDGTLDGSFNATGKVLTDFGGVVDAANAVAIDQRGRSIAAGTSNANGRLDFALARYLP